MDREEFNRKQRENRKATGNAATKKYEKTVKGFLMRTYRNMKSRVTGIQKKKFHLYEGKELISKERFYQWSLTNKDFKRLFAQWEILEYDRRYTPSIDRVDTSKGYTPGNIRWITHSENSKLGGMWKPSEHKETA